jgi:hypothetical protein
MSEIDLIIYLATGAAFIFFAGLGLGIFVAWRRWMKKVERLELL